jgi:hypothetical protein
MNWKIKEIIDTGPERWNSNYAHLGFHDFYGNQFAIHYTDNWIGKIEKEEIKISIGKKRIGKIHYYLDLLSPKYLTGTSTGILYITDSNGVYKINSEDYTIKQIIDINKYDFKDIGNCEYDGRGNLWINEITGCRIWNFDQDGVFLRLLGNGEPGFSKTPSDFDNSQFNWIFDLRRSPDGNIYVLDSKNYAIRMIDIMDEKVKTIAGTGKCGYTGDNRVAIEATFGSSPNEKFDGPWSMSIDELGNIFIGDTQNHVVRMISQKNGIITTIAGKTTFGNERANINAKNPEELFFNKICSLDYWANQLFIPDWDGELVILEKY